MKATKTMKILIIKLNKIGDVLLTSPLFANLKAVDGSTSFACTATVEAVF